VIVAITAERDLEALVDAQLVTPDSIDAYTQLRYRYHDLVRLFAAERAHAEESPAVRRAVVVRALQARLSVFDLTPRDLPAADMYWRLGVTPVPQAAVTPVGVPGIAVAAIPGTQSV
jgi:hypothetical protein